MCWHPSMKWLLKIRFRRRKSPGITIIIIGGGAIIIITTIIIIIPDRSSDRGNAQPGLVSGCSIM